LRPQSNAVPAEHDAVVVTQHCDPVQCSLESMLPV
jgi:hypothetical protein